MLFLVCCATSWELKTVKTQIKALNLKSNLKISYLCTGIGNYETIYTLTKFLTEHAESDFFLVNIGICWHTCLQTPPKAIQIWRIKNLTTQKELLPPLPKELLPPLPIVFEQIASIRSSETVMTEQIIEENSFVDMESRGIELVCDKFRIPRLFLKVPFDKIWIETQNFDKEKALEMLANHIDYERLIKRLTSQELIH